MLRIRTLGAMGAGLILAAGAANAADIYQPPPPTSGGYYTPTPAFSWTGAYLGLQGGYNWGSSATQDGTNTVGTSGWKGGIYGGYNFQTGGPLVVGIEGDINANGAKGTDAGVTVSNPWDGSIRGRVGVAADRFLIYGTGGVAFGQVKATDGIDTDTTTRTGWTAGAGVEAAVTDNVVARLEYRYTNLGTADLPNFGTTSYSSNAVMVGVGYKF
jgi:outer membrane immunogenic protein